VFEGLSKLKIFSMVSVAILACLFARPLSAAELNMNVIEFCPNVPYERWYPLTRASTAVLGKMNITPRTIFFSEVGQFRYSVQETAEGHTYLKLSDKPEKNNPYQFIYLKYAGVRSSDVYHAIIYPNKSCLLEVYDCKDGANVEQLIREKNGIALKGEPSPHCNQLSYVRHVDRPKLKRYLPTEPDDPND